jgi:molybdenum cofactor cytidylyltransferase
LITAVVLAAGKSQRMGRPKALLPYCGTTFLGHILETIGRSCIDHQLVVLGHDRERIAATIEGVDWVYNPSYEQGMTTSLQAGIRALPEAARGAMLFLVDHPVFRVATVEGLVSGISAGAIVLPVCEGRRGHPVLFARAVFEEILNLGNHQGANIVVRRDPARVVEVPVDDPGVLLDIDTPDAFERLSDP